MAAPSKTVKIGKYDVVETIGRGGMGTVYLARDPFLDRLVAIKMMNVDVHESRDFLERFYREAKGTASLRHANIVTVFDLGEDQGRPFLVMEYLEGNSLEVLLRSHHPMSLLEKLNIVIETCQGLSYAHQRGIIHRDIKPGNIMVLNDGGVKIVDFGIARLGDQSMTRTGQIVGSLYYMSPEQIREQGVDARADIYAAGVVLYQLLTYALPFEAESAAATLAKILSDEPAPFREFDVSCPPELEAITFKALAKNRDQRFASADAFALSLSEVQNQLKQEFIQEYLEKADLLRQSHELLQAQECVLKALKLDRQNTTAARLLSAIRADLQAQLSAQRVRQLREQAEEAFGREDYETAIASVNHAIELEKTPELENLRAAIEKAKADAELVRKAVARAEAAQRSGDLDSAKSAIDTAFSRRPNDSNIKALRRAIERDLEERERQRKVEGLLDAARKYMGERKFTSALDFLREAQKLDPSAPQLRVLLERLASEHQQEKRRKELEQFKRAVQEAIDRDDYQTASAKAAEGLAKFSNEATLQQLRELADTQLELAAKKEFVRKQTARAQELLDGGLAHNALECVELALTKAPGDARLDSFRTMLRDRLAKDRDEADKSTCLRQANEAIAIGRYGDAIQLLEAARVRFTDSAELDERLRFARDQQAKAERQKLVEEAMRNAQRLGAERRFDAAVQLLQSAVQQVPSEDLELLLVQVKAQQESFTREIQAAIAKGRRLLDEGTIADAREFLGSRPNYYRQSPDFANLLAKAQAAVIPPREVAASAAAATQMFSPIGQMPAAPTPVEQRTTLYEVKPEEAHPRVEEPGLEEPPPPKSKIKLMAIGAAILVVAIAAVIWLLWPRAPKLATVTVQTQPGAHVFVDNKLAGTAQADGTLLIGGLNPGQHSLRTSLDKFTDGSEDVTLNAGERKTLPIAMETVLPPPPPPPAPPPPVFGKLLLRSNVEKAEVLIDGKLKGLTERGGGLELPLEPGKYKVQLKKNSYQDSPEQKIQITAKKDTTAKLKLEKSTTPISPAVDTYLNIQAPPNTQIRVDDGAPQRVGNDRTLFVKVQPGEHPIRAELDGYEPWASRETVSSGEKKAVDISLVPKVVVTPPPPPTPKPQPIVSFVPSKEILQEGESVTLSWNTRDADTVSISPEVGAVETNGNRTVHPTKNTAYTLIAKGPGGDAVARVNITVQPKPQPIAEKPKPEANPLPPQGVNEADAVHAAIDRYARAFESMNPVEMKRAWLNTRQVDKIIGTLLHEQNLHVQESCPDQPSISGNTATWSCLETMSGLRELKPFNDPPHRILFTLQKQSDGKWIVSSRQGQ